MSFVDSKFVGFHVYVQRGDLIGHNGRRFDVMPFYSHAFLLPLLANLPLRKNITNKNKACIKPDVAGCLAEGRAIGRETFGYEILPIIVLVDAINYEMIADARWRQITHTVCA